MCCLPGKGGADLELDLGPKIYTPKESNMTQMRLGIAVTGKNS